MKQACRKDIPPIRSLPLFADVLLVNIREDGLLDQVCLSPMEVTAQRIKPWQFLLIITQRTSGSFAIRRQEGLSSRVLGYNGVQSTMSSPIPCLWWVPGWSLCECCSGHRPAPSDCKSAARMPRFPPVPHIAESRRRSGTLSDFWTWGPSNASEQSIITRYPTLQTPGRDLLLSPGCLGLFPSLWDSAKAPA